MPGMTSRISIFFVLCFFFSSLGLAQETVSQAPTEEEIAEDWLENYYKDPSPDRFVKEVKAWAEDGTLDNPDARPALIAFLSQVIRANRDRLAEWDLALRGLEPSHKQVINTAMLFSRTTEADEILREQFGERYDKQKTETEKILEMPLDAEPTLHMLWGFYYATGSANAIRRLVLCFRFVDAPYDPGGVAIPNGYMPYYKMLPLFAYESLVANAERHPRVVEILKTLHEKDESLLPLEKEGVYDVLSEILPEQFPPVKREGATAKNPSGAPEE